MRRLRVLPPDPGDTATRQGVMVASPSGALALLLPLLLPPGVAGGGGDTAQAVAALRALQQEVAMLVPSVAGLNPAAFRCAGLGLGGRGR